MAIRKKPLTIPEACTIDFNDQGLRNVRRTFPAANGDAELQCNLLTVRLRQIRVISAIRGQKLFCGSTAPATQD